MSAEDKNLNAQGLEIKQTIPMAGIYKMTADHLIKSYLTAAAVTVQSQMRVDGLVRLRAEVNSKQLAAGGEKISYTPFIIKAIAQGLGVHPRLNATLAEEGIQILADINIGLAVNMPDGNLIVPVIHQADKKSLVEVSQKAKELQDKASIGKLSLPDVQGGTFTVSNAGMLPHAWWSTPIINQPQGAILALGPIRQAPVVEDGQLAVGWVMTTSLTYDHRLVHGYPASLFLETLAELLAGPDKLELGI